MENDRLVRIYLEELGDRALRFHQHLDAVEREFYETSSGLAPGTIPRDKPLFLDSFRRCVWKALETASHLASNCKPPLSDTQRDALMNVARHAFVCINRLHEEGLIHLPRPSEPVELRRFCRIISRYVLRRETTDLAVYITETTADSAFAADPISNVKRQYFADLVEMANGALGSNILQGPVIEGTNSIHVTIARIDARNPVRWPTLLHEAGHKLLTVGITDGHSLNEQFTQWLPDNTHTDIATLNIKTEAWLTEVWCDLFAALVMGPSFFFSQFSAFIATPPTDNTLSPHYPPHGFRLRLIAMFLRHFYDLVKSDPIKAHMQECLEVVDYWDRSHQFDLGSNSKLLVAFETMRGFFQEHFFSGQGTDGENFHKKFEKMVRYVRLIDHAGLLRMQSELAQGLPIPSKPRSGNVPLAEEPTSVQEVLLAGWLDRLERVRRETIVTLCTVTPEDWGVFLTEKVLPRLERFDDAVLRSLQLAEWLHLLTPTTPQPIAKPKGDIATLRNTPPSLLNDQEIVELLACGELRIMPLVDLDQQLGSTSFDIRLGTSFQVYLPACRRTPDVTPGLIETYDSRRIDLDYLEHIVLLPGQFMLAHSFEYIKLPGWVAATLDGRSSYARLGLEVHMTAGMIDPGFEGVVTFELLNGGPNPIQLFPGLRIGQLRFKPVNEPSRPYSKRHSAKYRGLLHHNASLYMNDPDFKRIHTAIEELDARRQGNQPKMPPVVDSSHVSI